MHAQRHCRQLHTSSTQFQLGNNHMYFETSYARAERRPKYRTTVDRHGYQTPEPIHCPKHKKTKLDVCDKLEFSTSSTRTQRRAETMESIRANNDKFAEGSAEAQLVDSANTLSKYSAGSDGSRSQRKQQNNGEPN